jgi:hypothetical protein
MPFVPWPPSRAEQQKAERARFIVEKAEQEQLAEVIRAEGDSEVCPPHTSSQGMATYVVSGYFVTASASI